MKTTVLRRSIWNRVWPKQIGIDRADWLADRHIRFGALPVRERDEEGVADKPVDKDEDRHRRRREQQRRQDALQRESAGEPPSPPVVRS